MEQTILIVDDNPDDLEITRRVLSKSGIALVIKEALCGEAAIDMLREMVCPASANSS